MKKHSVVSESEIDSTKIYFHGSNNGAISKFDPPSIEKPLFVTSDIDYANSYIEAVTVNGRSQFVKESEGGKVYMVSLNSSKIRMFDATKSGDIKKLRKFWPEYLVKSLELRKYSIWSVFKFVVPVLGAYYNYSGKKTEKLLEWMKKTKFEDELGNEVLAEGIAEIDKKHGAKLEKIFDGVDGTDKDKAWNALFETIALFNHTLAELGFNAFRNVEKNKKISTDNAVGLMAVETLDSLFPKPLDQEMVARELEKIEKARKTANEKIVGIVSAVEKNKN